MAEPAGSPLPAPPAGRREDVLRTLRAAGEPQTIVSLAAQLQLHPNTVRFHLDSLIAAGRVRQADRGPRRRGRPALLYEAIQGMDPGGPRGYQTLAEIFTVGVAARPDAEALALEAGRCWGRQRAVDTRRGTVQTRLVGLMDELGFAPERQSAGGSLQIGLRHCPFLELAESHTSVICPVHLGLMQGAMEVWDGAQTVTRLEPFVEPDLCVAHLSAPTSAFSASD
jgi:predicted ArsR family transcriptional regulator